MNVDFTLTSRTVPRHHLDEPSRAPLVREGSVTRTLEDGELHVLAEGWIYDYDPDAAQAGQSAGRR